MHELDDYLIDRTGQIEAVFGESANNQGPEFVPVLSRTVLIVMTVLGIVENGGIGYLVNGDLEGDLDWKHSMEAFRRIGCIRSANILQAVMKKLQSLPGLEDRKQRYKNYSAEPEHWKHSQSLQFWDTGDEIRTKLASFLRINEVEIDRELADGYDSEGTVVM